MIYDEYAKANAKLHGFDIVKVDPEYGYMIECKRCHQRFDFAEQAIACEDYPCPMNGEHLERVTEKEER